MNISENKYIELIKLLKMVGRAFSYQDEGIIIMDYLTEYKVIYEDEISTKLNLQPSMVKNALKSY